MPVALFPPIPRICGMCGARVCDPRQLSKSKASDFARRSALETRCGSQSRAPFKSGQCPLSLRLDGHAWQGLKDIRSMQSAPAISFRCPRCGHLEHFHQSCSDELKTTNQRSFWILASFRLSHRVLKTAHSPKCRHNPKILVAHLYI